MSQRRIKPWMVAVALALVGIVGATLVYATGANLHRSDRRAIVAWYSAGRSSLEQIDLLIKDVARVGPRVFDATIPEARAAREITRLRSGIEGAKFSLEHLRVETVMDVIAGAYLNASVEALAAVTALHQWTFARGGDARARERDTFETKIASAARHWKRADSAFADLRSRFAIR